MKEKVEEILLKHSPYVFFGNAVKTELFGETVKHLTTLINQERKEAVEGFVDLLKSGEGRKTGVWHYELNDRNEMEASWAGEYISIKEMKKAYETYLTQQSLDKGDTDENR